MQDGATVFLPKTILLNSNMEENTLGENLSQE